MSKPWFVFPPAFIDRIRTIYPDRSNQIFETLSHTRPTTFRANTLKVESSKLEVELTKAGFELERLPWSDNAFILRNKSLTELSEHELYLDGSIYVQGLSSQIPPLVLDPKPGEVVLDIAAAPGSKTTQMAAMMNNQGVIWANDTSRIRLYKLDANLERQGVTIAHTKHGLGQNIWEEFTEHFDKTLVDVPCSMEGRFNTEKPKSWENWSPKKIKELAVRQRQMLRSAISATKVGGTIVYSTCTLSPEENEGVIEWILKRLKGAVVVEPVELNIELDPALATWKHKTFDPQIALTRRIVPSETMEGFYVAKLKKVASTV